MEDFIPTAALASTVYALVALLRFVRGRDWDGAATILTVWAGGVGAAWLFAQSDWAETIAFFNGQALADLNFASLLVVGLQVGSAATVLNEFRGAIDRTSTTAKPRLLSGVRHLVLEKDQLIVHDSPPPSV